MTVSTQGIELDSDFRVWRNVVKLLSSMRFSIFLLTLICIASVIGTLLKQQEPMVNYVNQFSPFRAQVFSISSLIKVCSAWCFSLILAYQFFIWALICFCRVCTATVSCEACGIFRTDV